MYAAKILVLLPHPDDEVVGCGVAIKRAIQQGCEVAGLYLTHGCIPLSHRWFWQRKTSFFYERAVKRRLQEAESVAVLLGLKILRMENKRGARELWKNLAEILPEVLKAIEDFQPNVIWVPGYEGGNPDHDGLNGLSALLPKFCKAKIFEFAEYSRLHKQKFTQLHGRETEIILTEEERTFKRKLFSLYASQKINLLRFKKPTREQFRPLLSYDYNQSPHAGKLWYQNFQWLPFRHPMVDYTLPSDVSKAILDLHNRINHY